jgi:hypothetical protein
MRWELVNKTYVGFLCCGLFLTVIVSAQSTDTTKTPPFPATAAFSEWSVDSQWYTYVDFTLPDTTSESIPFIGSTLPASYWVAYSPYTDRYIVDNEWFLQPQLTPVENSTIITDDLIRTSPDETLLLFSSPENGQNGNPSGFSYRLFDRSSGEIIDTTISTFSPVNTGPEDRVLWSDNNNAYTLSLTDNFGSALIYYFPDPLDSDLLWIPIQSIEINSTTYALLDTFKHDLYDISSQGTDILLTAEDMASPGFSSYLMTWNPIESEGHVVSGFFAEDVVTAGFSSRSDSELIIVDNRGTIHLYDLESNEQRVITNLPRNLFFAGNPDSPKLSPNGEWLAYFTLQPTTQLNFLNIAELLSTN